MRVRTFEDGRLLESHWLAVISRRLLLIESERRRGLCFIHTFGRILQLCKSERAQKNTLGRSTFDSYLG